MFFPKFFGSANAGALLPLDDVERGLNERCTAVRDPETPEKAHIPNSNFKQIRFLLRHYELHKGLTEWSTRPRLYAILRRINRLKYMPIFIQHNLLDYSLPFSLANIPQGLGDDRRAFLSSQDLVLTDARELERGIEGKHVRFPKSADEHFHRIHELGSGGFGSVDHVWSRLSLKPYARKRFRRGNDFRENQQRSRNFEQEIKVLKRLNHIHLVKIVGSYTDQQYFAFIMSPVAECNLETFLRTKRDSHEDRNSLSISLRQYFGCLTNAVAYLHKQKIQHMDIKPDNILIKHGRVYVADFGAAHDWSRKSRSTTFSPFVSTPGYRAPEIVRDPHAPKNSMTDMWSLGVVFLEMATVLRGRTVTKFRQYLTQNGTKHPHVYGNSPATYEWFDRLRSSDAGPDSDIEPLTWIKDLLAPEPLNRPEAKALAGQILNRTFSGNFCGICCSQPDEPWDSYPEVELNSSPDSSVINYEDEYDDNDLIMRHDRPHQSGANEGTGPVSIEGWLDLQHNINIDTETNNSVTPASEYDGLPYEVVEDEDDEEQGTEVFHVPYYLPKRLSTLNLHTEEDESDFPKDQHEMITEDEEVHLPYEIVSDESGSEDTVRPTEAPPEWLSQLEDEELSVSPNTGPARGSDELPGGARLPEIAEEGLSETATLKSSAAAMHSSNDSTSSANADVKLPEEVPTISVRPVSADNNSDAINSESPALETHSSGPSTKDRLSRNARNLHKPKVTLALTAGNLAQLEDPQSKKLSKSSESRLSGLWENAEGLLRPEPRISAKGYMHETWEAESSAATSIMSENTKRKLGANMSMLPWQDKSFRYLDYYAKSGKAAAVRYLLEARCNPGTRKRPRPEPLLNAVRGGSERHNKCVRILLEFGADVNIINGSSGKTPLHYAIEHRLFRGYRNLIFILLARGADPNIKDYSGDVPLLKILYGGYEPLEQHRREALALLFQQTRFDIDVDVMPPGTLNRPLHLAVRRQDPYAVGMLLEKGAKVDEPNGAEVTPLALAAVSWGAAKSAYRVEVLEQLLCHGAVVDERIGTLGSTALHLAIIHGQIQLAELLLQYNANPNAKDTEGESAFTMAVYLLKDRKISAATHAALLRLLFRHAHEDIPEIKGECALVSAVKTSDLEAAAILFQRGANAHNWSNVFAQKLLVFASAREDSEMVAVLKELFKKCVNRM